MVQVIMVIRINTRADAETIVQAIKTKFASQLDSPKIVSADIQINEASHESIKTQQ